MELFGSNFWKEINKKREIVRNILGKCFTTDLNIMCQTDFYISLYVLTSKNTVSAPFCHFEIRKFKVAIIYNFWKGELIIHLLDQE